jgi:transcriptional regulator with XRE-family HTH domain
LYNTNGKITTGAIEINMTKNIEPNVGLRLRSLREHAGLSLRALAERCGLSINAISQIERCENSPTVSTLQRLAAALNISIAEFFQEEARQTIVLVENNLGMRFYSNGVMMESLGIGLSNQQIEPFRLVIQPGAGNMEDQVSHPGEEFIHCMEGVIEYSIAGKIFYLERGDSLLFEASQSHAYHNTSSKPAELMMIYRATRDRPHLQQLHREK